MAAYCDNCGAQACNCTEEEREQDEFDRMIEAGWYQAQDRETGEPYWRPPSR